MMSEATSTTASVWDEARESADVIVELPPCRGPRRDPKKPIELFLKRIPATGPRGFRMGVRGVPNAEPVHRVVIEHDFYLGTFPVTQEQWESVWTVDAVRNWYQESSVSEMKSRPSDFDKWHASRHPVERVSWYDALAFCEALSVINPCLKTKDKKSLSREYKFCLPTEAEWEYACRGLTDPRGPHTEYWSGDGEESLSKVGWYARNAEDRTHDVTEPVDPTAPQHSLFGLYGMHGNVEEWCQGLDPLTQQDYRGCEDGNTDSRGNKARVSERQASRTSRNNARAFIRGGGYWSEAQYCRSGCRGSYMSDMHHRWIGFRVCLAPISGID